MRQREKDLYLELSNTQVPTGSSFSRVCQSMIFNSLFHYVIKAILTHLYMFCNSLMPCLLCNLIHYHCWSLKTLDTYETDLEMGRPGPMFYLIFTFYQT
jgi:uncharacterized protein YqhQ